MNFISFQVQYVTSINLIFSSCKEGFVVSTIKHMEPVWVQRWPVDRRVRKMVPETCLNHTLWNLPATVFSRLA